MSGGAPSGGGREISGRIEFQLLWHRVRVATPDDVMADRIAEVIPSAVQAMTPVRGMDYDLMAGSEGFEVLEQGDHLGRAETPEEARNLVYVRMHRRAFELASLAGWIRLHAALVDIVGRRVLVAGPSGVGKTTLALRLLHDGYAVQGDESVLARGGRVVAVPRLLHVKPGSDRLVPEVERIRSRLPHIGDVALLDPGRCGFTWRLHEAPLDQVILLSRETGAEGCVAVPQTAVVAALVQDVFPVAETKQVLLRELTAAIAGVRCHRLVSADPAAMRDAVLDVVGATEPVTG